MNINTKDIMEKLTGLLETPSPSGSTDNAIIYVEKLFNELGLKTKRTVKGALIATLEGIDSSRSVAMSGHVDTLGAMVKEIKPNGRIRLTKIGGYAMNSIEGENVTIEASNGRFYTGTVLLNNASVHVHSSEVNTTERKDSNMEVRIDQKVSDDKDIRSLGIEIGDFVFLNPRVEVTETGFIKSRHLDDKAGVISIYGIAKYMVENNIKPTYNTHFFISNYEEVGHGASSGIPSNVFEFIAIDMAAMGDGQASSEFKTTICVKDSTGPYSKELSRKLINLAKENNVEHCIDIYPFYGSDGSAALASGYDFKVALIGPGVDASHSYERTHIDAIKATIELGVLYLSSK